MASAAACAAAKLVIRPESTIAQAAASATTRCRNGRLANFVRKNWSPASRPPAREQPISNEIPAPGGNYCAQALGTGFKPQEIGWPMSALGQKRTHAVQQATSAAIAGIG